MKKPYKYSPSALLLFFGLPDSYPEAWIVAKFVLVSFWGIAISLGATFTTRRNFLLLLLGIVASWKGILETLDFGQMESVCFFLAVISTRLFIHYPLLSGLLIGLLPAIKLPWALLSIPFIADGILSREYKSALRFVTGFLSAIFSWGVVIPVLAFGLNQSLDLYQDWFLVLQAQPIELFKSDYNQSLWITLERFF